MVLIIQGPPGTGKSIIAHAIKHSAGATIYDGMPAEKPAEFPISGFVIITTNLREYPNWIHQTHFHELFTKAKP